ncbi:hypothetical protein ACJMK2_007599 [Sinanodonta woodiana]|uniref:Uncharacterized protein n=1 Tax=Sinanodonta woodiana TaxID=1069815 RepID=A0ABD3VKK7_SINWO
MVNTDLEVVPSHIGTPDSIELKASAVASSCIGAWSLWPIVKDTVFGPFIRDIKKGKDVKDINYRYAWEVFDPETFGLLHVIDATDPSKGNWMRYVNCARYLEEQNMISVQQEDQVYYKAIKNIEPGEELLIWFEPRKKNRGHKRKIEKEVKEEKVSATTTDPADAEHDKDDDSLGKRKRKPKIFPDYYQEIWLPRQRKLKNEKTDIKTEEDVTNEEKKNAKCGPKECTGKDQKGKSSPKKKYHCSRCSQTFGFLQNLLRHQEVHKDEKNTSPHSCEYCGKGFPSLSNLKKHVRFHLGYRISCRYCGDIHKNVGGLRKHIRIAHPEVHKEKLKNKLAKDGVLRKPDRKVVDKKSKASKIKDQVTDPTEKMASNSVRTVVTETPEMVALFYANVANNIAINMTNYIDGGQNLLQNCTDHIRIEDYDELPTRQEKSAGMPWDRYNVPFYITVNEAPCDNRSPGECINLEIDICNQLQQVVAQQKLRNTSNKGDNYGDEQLLGSDDSLNNSPLDNFENIAFGKHGNIACVCGVCRKQFQDLDCLEHHHMKKHPLVAAFNFLEVEQGNGIDLLHYSEPSSVGVLAVSNTGFKSATEQDIFHCTGCGSVFKNVSRLHVHIVNCVSTSKLNKSSDLNKNKKKKTSISLPDSPVKLINKDLYDTGYNPNNHIRRRESTELLDTHQCSGCGVKFMTILLLERHVKICAMKEKFKELHPLKSWRSPLIELSSHASNVQSV